MNKLKRLAVSFTLMSVLAVTTFAGETAPHCLPGQTNSPPCASQSVTDDSTAPGQTPTGPGQTECPPHTVDLMDIVEAALWSLLLF
jgi:hypothetical protein